MNGNYFIKRVRSRTDISLSISFNSIQGSLSNLKMKVYVQCHDIVYVVSLHDIVFPFIRKNRGPLVALRIIRQVSFNRTGAHAGRAGQLREVLQ